MTKPKCKACHNKTYHASYNAEDANARSKRKSPFYTWNETANAHSQVRKSLTKQDRFKMHQKYCQCTRCSETSQPLWNEVSIAVQPEWLLDPPHFNKALVTNPNTFYWGEDLETPRSMEVSSSSLLQFPSWEGIQAKKNWLNTIWHVTDATATSKEVAGTDSGVSFWL